MGLIAAHLSLLVLLETVSFMDFWTSNQGMDGVDLFLSLYELAKMFVESNFELSEECRVSECL